MQPRRITPVGPAAAYKTYSVRSPLATHFRKATCQEVDCANYEKGWMTRLDVSSPQHAQLANDIRLKLGRKFVAVERGTVVEFTFPPGQQCFAAHRLPLQRPEFYVVRGGDHRGNPRGTAPVQHNADTWLDDFANHQDRLKTALDRG